VESRSRWWRSVCEELGERRVGGHGLEGWWWGLPYIGSGRREAAGEVGNGQQRCGLKAES
jgi:hypothetical protein